MSHFRKDPLSYRPGDQVVGRYRITGILGKGGFGAVYAAEHTGTHQRVALKMLTVDPEDTDDDIIARFYREARITAQLQSFHTVRVFDVGEAEDGPIFMAMEMLNGPDLSKILRAQRKAGERMGQVEAVQIALQILKSLGEAHKAGLVHRDLKPANVILADMGEEEPVVKVLDFGIARTEDSSLTAQGKALGTPAYMSPEQCRGQDLDGRSDLYSLGCILHQCLTGSRPYETREAWALMRMHMADPVPDPRALNPRISGAVAACVMQAMAKEPAQRFSDAREMRHALQSALGGAWAGTPATPLEAMEPREPVIDEADQDSLPTLALGATPSGRRAIDAPSATGTRSVAGSRAVIAGGLVALVLAAVGYALLGGEGRDGPPTEPAPRATSDPAAGTAPPPGQPTAVTAPVAATAAATAAVAAPMEAVPAKVAPVARVVDPKAIEAEAKAELARATTDLARKVTFMKEAVALDPANRRYSILLAAYEKALARPPGQGVPSGRAHPGKPAPHKPARKRHAAVKPAIAVRLKPKAKKEDSGGGGITIQAID